VIEFMRDIKLVHSVFALPFALSVLFLSEWHLPDGPSFLLIVLCMVCARSFAMGANRYLDWRIDQENARTAERAIPAGRLTPTQALAISLGWAVAFVVFASLLSPTAGWLSLPVLAILAGYPLCKHLGWAVHWYLGLCLGLSPLAVAVALKVPISPEVIFLAFSVMFWTAGFDILYAMQDLEFDQKKGLASVPARFGVRGGLWISRASFFLASLGLVLVGSFSGMGVIYFSGVAIIAFILIAQHWMISDIDAHGHSKNTGVVFLNLNAAISVIFLLACLVDGLVL